jgi:hypothetical protein
MNKANVSGDTRLVKAKNVCTYCTGQDIQEPCVVLCTKFVETVDMMQSCVKEPKRYQM